jgi:hypothetical protein
MVAPLSSLKIAGITISEGDTKPPRFLERFLMTLNNLRSEYLLLLVEGETAHRNYGAGGFYSICPTSYLCPEGHLDVAAILNQADLHAQELREQRPGFPSFRPHLLLFDRCLPISASYPLH